MKRHKNQHSNTILTQSDFLKTLDALIQSIADFSNNILDNAITAIECKLEQDYHDEYWNNTSVKINEDLTATIHQFRDENLLKNEEYDDSQEWHLSEYEVSTCMIESIYCAFENFLQTINNFLNIETDWDIRQSENTIEILGFLSLIYDAGKEIFSCFEQWHKNHSGAEHCIRYFKEYLIFIKEREIVKKLIDNYYKIKVENQFTEKQENGGKQTLTARKKVNERRKLLMAFIKEHRDDIDIDSAAEIRDHESSLKYRQYLKEHYGIESKEKVRLKIKDDIKALRSTGDTS